jgi:hypothetical protein
MGSVSFFASRHRLNLLGLLALLVGVFGDHDHHVYRHRPPLSSTQSRALGNSTPRGMSDLAVSRTKNSRVARPCGRGPDGGPLHPRAVSRLSPEAPVPVVDVHHEEFMPGGAGNVAANIAALGVKPHSGVIGGGRCRWGASPVHSAGSGGGRFGGRGGPKPPHHP